MCLDYKHIIYNKLNCLVYYKLKKKENKFVFVFVVVFFCLIVYFVCNANYIYWKPCHNRIQEYHYKTQPYNRGIDCYTGLLSSRLGI